jgi:molybdate transport repressor ModE-like protein
MNMSYKRAWDLVNEINRICKRTAVARWEGGKGGGGAMLTPFGVSLVARYRNVERLVESAPTRICSRCGLMPMQHRRRLKGQVAINRSTVYIHHLTRLRGLL